MRVNPFSVDKYTRIIGSDAFETQPAGVDGLTVMVKAHPTLQSNLLDFVEALPIDHLGPWVVSGWRDVIKDPEANKRLEALIRRYATEAKSEVLKASAVNVLRMTRRSE